ncbi:synaptic vesicle 2-related protein-like [Amphibalanus amphitrite]|uniref:synaptic vesicle 2-related protein-like n=1 Tax=Amphibalanus amphitrite TaxID=1232801 RepID=UPI001C901B5B|nr:synaptic vesicle 2-related protein-like [Amphibalanus amphitrite]
MPVGESKYQAMNGDRGTEMTSTTIAEPSKAVTYSLDEAIDWVGFGRLQLQLGVLLGLSWLSESMEVMLLSLLSPALLCDWRISPWRQATVSTAVFVGMTCGQLYWGRFADRHGRKPTMLVSGFFLAYFGFLSSFAPTFIWITILRCLVGFFIGSVQQVVTLFTEFIPTNQRGKSLIIIQLFWTSGAILEVLLAMVVVPTLGWRWLLATSSIPLVLFALLSPLLVESPRYHAACGRPELAQATMDLLAAKNGRALPPGHLETSSANDESRGHFPDLLSRQNRRTSVLLWTLWMMVTFCYYGIIMLATELLKMPEDQMCSAIDEPQQERVCQAHCATLTKADYLDVLWTALSELPGLLLTVLLVDKIGRKKTIAGGLLIFILSLSVPLFCIHR